MSSQTVINILINKNEKSEIGVNVILNRENIFQNFFVTNFNFGLMFKMLNKEKYLTSYLNDIFKLNQGLINQISTHKIYDNKIENVLIDIEIVVEKQINENYSLISLKYNKHKYNQAFSIKFFTFQGLFETLSEENLLHDKLLYEFNNKNMDNKKKTHTWDDKILENSVCNLQLNFFKYTGTNHINAQVIIDDKILKEIITYEHDIISEASGIFKNLSKNVDVLNLINTQILKSELSEKARRLNNPPDVEDELGTENITYARNIGEIKIEEKIGENIFKEKQGKLIPLNTKPKTSLEVATEIFNDYLFVSTDIIVPFHLNPENTLKFLLGDSYNILKEKGLDSVINNLVIESPKRDLILKNMVQIIDEPKTKFGPIESIGETINLGWTKFGNENSSQLSDLIFNKTNYEKDLKQFQDIVEGPEFQTLSEFEKCDIIEAMDNLNILISITLRRINRLK